MREITAEEYEIMIQWKQDEKKDNPALHQHYEKALSNARERADKAEEARVKAQARYQRLIFENPSE